MYIYIYDYIVECALCLLCHCYHVCYVWVLRECMVRVQEDADASWHKLLKYGLHGRGLHIGRCCITHSCLLSGNNPPSCAFYRQL